MGVNTMNYEKLRQFRNSHNNFAEFLGLEITEIGPGYARAKMPVRKEFRNPIGSVHGGCIFTIADAAGCSAASSYGYHITTISNNLNFLNPGINTNILYATTREIKRGKRILVYDVSVTDENDILLAEGIFSFMSLNKPIEL